MQLSDLDENIQECILRFSEKVRILGINVVPNNTNREEYEIVYVSSGMEMEKVYLWKNPDNTYGWSEFPELQQAKREKFMGDIKQ
jgi:hypothetical protein